MRGKQRKWINGSASWKIDAIVKMARRGAGIARIADIAQKVARPDDIPCPDRCYTLEVSVIVDSSARPQHGDDIASQPILPDSHDDPVGGRMDRRSLRGKYVDSFMGSPAASERSPRIPQAARLNAGDRHRQSVRRFFEQKLDDKNGIPYKRSREKARNPEQK